MHSPTKFATKKEARKLASNFVFLHIFCNETSRVFAKICANFRTTGWGFGGKTPVVQLAVGFGKLQSGGYAEYGAEKKKEVLRNLGG